MTKAVDFDLGGLHLKVVVEYEDKSVGGVELVFGVAKDGREMLLECDTAMFYESFMRELQEALEDALADEKAYYEDMHFEQHREENWRKSN